MSTQPEEVVPAAVALCPVHVLEFYVPVNRDARDVVCPEPGCRRHLRVYVPRDETTHAATHEHRYHSCEAVSP